MAHKQISVTAAIWWLKMTAP